MASRFTKISTSFSLLLLSLAIILPLILLLTGQGVIPPSPELIVRVNGEEVRDFEQPVPVPIGKVVFVQIEYRGRPLTQDEFVYQWCFMPIINNELHTKHCLDDYYRTESNSDYTPETLEEQTLEITIRHDVFRETTKTIIFKPE